MDDYCIIKVNVDGILTLFSNNLISDGNLYRPLTPQKLATIHPQSMKYPNHSHQEQIFM
jgi:hypothetical protein